MARIQWLYRVVSMLYRKQVVRRLQHGNPILIGSLAVTITLIAYPIASQIIKPGDLGTWGDFVGGISNPIVALLALFALIKTLKLQQKEFREMSLKMAEQTEEMRQQRRLEFNLANVEVLTRTFDFRIENIKKLLGSTNQKMLPELEKYALEAQSLLSKSDLNKHTEDDDLERQLRNKTQELFKDFDRGFALLWNITSELKSADNILNELRNRGQNQHFLNRLDEIHCEYTHWASLFEVYFLRQPIPHTFATEFTDE